MSPKNESVGATGPLGELGCMAPGQIFKEILLYLKNEDSSILKKKNP